MRDERFSSSAVADGNLGPPGIPPSAVSTSSGAFTLQFCKISSSFQRNSLQIGLSEAFSFLLSGKLKARKFPLQSEIHLIFGEGVFQVEEHMFGLAEGSNGISAHGFKLVMAYSEDDGVVSALLRLLHWTDSVFEL